MGDEALTDIHRRLGKAKKRSDYESVLSMLFDRLVQLDSGMIEGRVVSADRARAVYAEASEIATIAFAAFAAASPSTAKAFLGDLPIYRRPQGLDLDALASTIGPAPRPEPLDLDRAVIEPALRDRLRALRTLVAAEPDRHLLHPPATTGEIDDREAELRVSLPPDLKTLYRLCDGFALFRRDGSHDRESSPFRLRPLAELGTHRQATGDDRRPRKIRAGVAPARLAEHLDRLQVFDLGNGDFLSCVCTPALTVWVDDWREQPRAISCRSVEEILARALDPARLDPETGRWSRPKFD